MVARNKPNEIRIIRQYDAPVEVVWDAWTDPEQVAKWWGPRGFTLTHHSKDLRPGGNWHYTMHGPDGTDYPNKTLYHEVEPHKKLVYDHGGYDDRPPLFRVTVLFSEIDDGKTQMDMTMAFPSPEAAKEAGTFIKQVGGNATWDRLAEYLGKESTGKEQFVINRAFDAPIDVMFEMWIDPEHLAKWLPPAGFDMEFIKSEIKPGGQSFWKMTNGKEVTMHGHFEYVMIEKPNLIVYQQQFVDADGNISRHPLAPVWPETLLTTVRLTAEDPDRTRVTVSMEPFGAATPEEVQAFVKERAGMTQGWTGSFDKLDAQLLRN